MRSPRWVARLLLPVVVVATSGCFATRNDVRIVQADVLRVREEVRTRDSVRAAADAQLLRLLGTVTDSLRSVSLQLGRHHADSREELYAIGQQLIQILATQGLSERRLQELRADLESRAQAPPVPPPSVMTGRDSTVAVAVDTAMAQPGPNQIYQAAFDQLRRGSYATARGGFDELLRLYPRSELASTAQLQIGVAYASEGQDALADSVFVLVAQRYPDSPDAPTALYKRGVALAGAGQTRLARTVLTQLVDRYPRAAEVELARDRLKTLPPTP